MSANIPAIGIGPVPETVLQSEWASWLTRIARVLNLVLAGKLNATGSVTLTASATSTTLTDSRIGPNSAVILVPQTAAAAIAVLTSPGIYVVPTRGSATINHPSNASTTQTFGFAVIG